MARAGPSSEMQPRGQASSQLDPLRHSQPSRRQETSPSSSSSSSSSPSSPSQSSVPPPNSPAALDGTRVVLGRGYSNGQLTYTMPISLAGQRLNFQLDTGSADTWVANNDCNTDSCKPKGSGSIHKFDDTKDSVIDQDTPFSITYLLGGASGAVKTTSMILGDPDNSVLAVNGQAFASANQVFQENLDTGNFSGVVGLGLPANSLIQASLNDTSNTAALNEGVNPSSTGAILSGLWRNLRNGRRFIGMGLQRLEEEGGSGDSVLTVGSHDPAYAGSDLNQIVYSAAVADGDGVARHWRTYINSLTVTLGDGTIAAIPVGTSSVIPGQYPIALLDSAASINLGPANVLNALYGAFGIGPANDNGYYVPCDLQMNISINIGGVNIPIHPLDASLYASSGGIGTSSSSSGCIGSFQALRSPTNGASLNQSSFPADFVLSNSFLRSVYTVLSCDVPNAAPLDAPAGPCVPQIGLRPLVNMTVATDQFRRVRINKESLGDSGLTNPNHNTSGSRGLSGGIKVVIGCMAALAVIILLFGVALWRLRRRRKLIAEQRAAMMNGGAGGDGEKGSIHRKDPEGGVALGRSATRRTGMLVPMADLAKEDDSSSNLFLSPAQRAKARQLQQMHGVFDDELGVDDEADIVAGAAGATPKWGEDSSRLGTNSAQQVGGGTMSWDMSSTGYIDARRIKNEYLKKLNEEDRQLFMTRRKNATPDAGSVTTTDVPDRSEEGSSARTDAGRTNTTRWSDPTSEHVQSTWENGPGQSRTGSPSPLLSSPRSRP